MNNPTPQSQRDAALSQLLQAALPVENAPESLKNRVAQLALSASQSPSKPVRSRAAHRLRRIALGTFALATMWMLCAVFWPRFVADQLIKRVEAAIAGVSSVRMEYVRLENGRRIPGSDTWFQNGKWRLENHDQGYANVFDRGNLWTYTAQTNTYSLRRGAKSPFSQAPGGFTFADTTRDLGARGEQTKVTLQGEAVLNGRPVKRTLLETQNSYETDKILYLIDAETDLPIKAQVTVRTRYGKESRGELVFSYNRRFPASLFRPVFRPGARFMDLQRREQLVTAQLQRGLARRKVGERTLAIRALQVSSSGAVWVFYTAGKRADDAFSDEETFFAGRDWKVFLTDSLGTRYEWMRDNLSFYSLTRRTIGGQRLEGDWWVPLSSPKPNAKWRPRTFSLRFELNPRNLHGAQNARFAPDYSARAVFQIPVSQRVRTVLPPLASSLRIGLSEQDVVRRESEERGELPPGTWPSPQLAREVDAPGVFSPDSRVLALPEAGQVRLESVADGAALRVLRASTGLSSLAQNVAFSPDGQTLFALFPTQTGGITGWRACLWNTRTGVLRASWNWTAGRDCYVRDLTFSPDGRAVRILSTLVTKRGGSGSRQWVDAMNALVEERDALTGRVLTRHLLPHDGFLLSALESNSGSTNWRAITNQGQKGSSPGTVRVWNAQGGVLERQLAIPSDFWVGRAGSGGDVVGISGNLLDKEGHVDFSRSAIRLYRVSTGEFLREVHPETSSSFVVPAVSRDEKWLAAESSDHTIGLWDVATGRLQLSLTGHYSTVNHLEFSPDGKWLLTGDIKDKTLLWRLP